MPQLNHPARRLWWVLCAGWALFFIVSAGYFYLPYSDDVSGDSTRFAIIAAAPWLAGKVLAAAARFVIG